MTLSIRQYQLPMGSSNYYDESWHLTLEMHLPNLLVDQQTQTQVIDDIIGYRYEGDLYSLLQYMGIAPQYHFVVMRMNGMRAPTEYRASMTSLIVPSFNKIERLFNVFNTVSKKIN